MKRLPVVILLVVALLVTVVAGCGGMRRHDFRLTAADSLMQSDPDSALSIVEGVCRDSLASEGDRAYRDLLLTQARYRCYIPATSDSDISRALAWYRVHDGEREKLTRALIYKGAVMEELSHPDSAMLYYKQAEATAAPDDYFNLGYVNLRIGALYRIHYANSQTGFDKYKQALRYFSLTGDSAMQQCCLYNMAMFHAIISENCQNRYLDQAISIATLMHDSLAIYDCLELRCRQLIIRDTALVEAKSLARKCLSDYSGYITADLLLDLAEAYAKLGNCDSARFFIEYVDENNVAAERIRIRIRKNDVLSIIAAKDNAKSGSSEFLARSHISSDSLLNNKTKNRIESIENSYNSSKNREIRNHSRVLIIEIILTTILCIIIGLVILYLIVKRRIKHYQRDLDMARAEIEKTIGEYEDRISEIESSLDKQRLLLDEKDKTIKKVAKENDKLISRQTEINRQISRIVRKRLAAINEIYSDIRLRTADNTAYKQSVPLISLIKGWNEKKQLYMITPKESFWKDLHQSIDDEYHGLASFVKNKYSLTVREFQLFLLLSAKISPQIIKLFMDFSNPTTVSNYKRRLMKNLTGHEMKLEDFIQDYLDGKLN